MNRKFIYPLMAMLMMAVVCVGFTSCGGDDDGNGAGPGTKLVVGTWVHKDKRGTDKYGKDINAVLTYTFNSDGTGHYSTAEERYNDIMDYAWKQAGYKSDYYSTEVEDEYDLTFSVLADDKQNNAGVITIVAPHRTIQEAFTVTGNKNLTFLLSGTTYTKK